MTYLTESELESAIREVIKRSVVDPEFRALAIKNGTLAISKASGKSLSSGTVVSFITNQDAPKKTFVLPDPVTNPEVLSEEALEQVAGGSCEATSCGTSKAEESV